MIYNWEKLNDKNHPIKKQIIAEWNLLLLNKKNKEQHYHKFIADYAGFLVPPYWVSNMVLSKIRLGSEFETDFVFLHDKASLGFTYELIEIESPHSPPYTKRGDPSARLTHAIQQVQNWMVWLNSYPRQAKKLFSGTTFDDSPSFVYTVVIGTRENSKLWLDRRNQFAKQTNISVRSFDWFSDLVAHKLHVNRMTGSSELEHLPHDVSNAMANPFTKAVSHKQWVDFNRKIHLSGHGIARNVELIIKLRQHNDLFEQFKKL